MLTVILLGTYRCRGVVADGLLTDVRADRDTVDAHVAQSLVELARVADMQPAAAMR